MWFIAVEVEQETRAPPPNKNPGSAPVNGGHRILIAFNLYYGSNNKHKLSTILVANVANVANLTRLVRL